MILFGFLSLKGREKKIKKISVHVPCLSSQINLSALHVLIFFHILKEKKILKDQNSLPSLELNAMRVIDTFKLIIELKYIKHE